MPQNNIDTPCFFLFFSRWKFSKSTAKHYHLFLPRPTGWGICLNLQLFFDTCQKLTCLESETLLSWWQCCYPWKTEINLKKLHDKKFFKRKSGRFQYVTILSLVATFVCYDCYFSAMNIIIAGMLCAFTSSISLRSARMCPTVVLVINYYYTLINVEH